MEPETAVKSIQKLLSVPLKHIFHFSPGLHNNEKSANPSIYDRIPTFLVVRPSYSIFSSVPSFDWGTSTTWTISGLRLMTGRKGRAPWLLSLSLSPTSIGGHDNVIGKTDKTMTMMKEVTSDSSLHPPVADQHGNPSHLQLPSSLAW